MLLGSFGLTRGKGGAFLRWGGATILLWAQPVPKEFVLEHAEPARHGPSAVKKKAALDMAKHEGLRL